MATSTVRLILIIAATLATSAAFAAQRTYDKRLEAPAGGRLTFDADVGAVTVVGTNAHEVVIHGDLEGSDAPCSWSVRRTTQRHPIRAPPARSAPSAIRF